MKFFVLFLILVLLAMVIILLDNVGFIDVLSFWEDIRIFFDLSLETKFYGWMSVTLGFVIIVAIIQANVKYVIVEKNEFYIHKILKAEAERYPTSGLHVKIHLTDIFEFISMGAGTIDLQISGEENYKLNTVPLVKRKKRKIDEMLSTTLIESEQ
ncbi:MAG: hypothetical protein GF364_06060 [Candidatus Lokiarchaeota archaeon]|nr:hypothetical protein [Candidatus Lokiarchaeota archaeon]